MENIYVFRDEVGEICGTASFSENGEKMSVSDPEYIAWTQKVFIPPWETIKNMRNELLAKSDWTAIPDANPKPSKEAWLTYRQALRDLPQNFSEPSEVVWPTKPE